jgi:DNA-binding protein Fis
MIIKPLNQSLTKTIRQLKAQITKLQQEKELLRLYLHELIEAYYRVINQNPTKEVFEMKLTEEESHA